LTFIANDSVSAEKTYTFRLIVDPVNDAPTMVTSLSVLKMKEDTINQTAVVLKDIFFDSDGPTVVYSSESSGNITAFIDQITGRVQFIPKNNWSGIDRVIFYANDGLTTPASEDIYVLVESVNDAPAVIAPVEDFPMNEDSIDDSTVNFNNVFYDSDNETLDYWYSGNINIQLTLLDLGGLSITPKENWTGTAPITLYASDHLTPPASESFTITVMPINDAPVFSAIPSTYTVNEDTSSGSVINLNTYFYDAEDGSLGLDYDLNVLSNESMVIADIGWGGFLTLDAYTGDQNDNWTGEVLSMVTATDSNGLEVTSNMFTVHVVPVNDAPIWTDSLPEANLVEDGQLIWTYPQEYTHDSDTLASDFIFSVESISNQDISVEINEDGRITIKTITENFFGTSKVVLRVSDGELYSDATFTVYVEPVNDPPNAVISSPVDGDTFTEGALISFVSLSWDVEGSENLDHHWEFGEGGSTSILGDPYISFGSIGIIRVTLTVTDSSGVFSSDFVNIVIEKDTDRDGLADDIDPDDDNDSTPDQFDAFPLNPNEWIDTDMDGIGNNDDTDDDGDGIIDGQDPYPLTPGKGAPEPDTLNITYILLVVLVSVIIIAAMAALRIRKRQIQPFMSTISPALAPEVADRLYGPPRIVSKCPRCSEVFKSRIKEGKVTCPRCGLYGTTAGSRYL
jgi:hypothetical protein